MGQQSNRSTPRGKVSSKPSKPYKDFPLFPHDSGRWAKKIRGKLHYFGRWGHRKDGEIAWVDDVEDSARQAVDLYNEQRDDLHAGRKPREKAGPVYTLKQLCNEFLTAKQRRVDSGELSPHTHSDYRRACEHMIGQFGRSRSVEDLGPDDFELFRNELASKYSPVTLANEVNRCRIVLKWASDQRKIDRPVHFGQSFDKPTARTLRQARNQGGQLLFTAAELRGILDALDGNVDDPKTGKPMKADPIMKAMVLLGINGGLGNTDVSELPREAIDFEGGWLEYPRPKTQVKRRIPLWPETLDAIRVAIDLRPAARREEDEGLVFLTIQGNHWVRIQPTEGDPRKYNSVNTVGHRFGALLKKLEINGRKRLGFYTLRHNFETIAGDSKDQVAVDAIMGHVDNSMAARYREEISDERLRSVVDHVHERLFAEEGKRRS